MEVMTRAPAAVTAAAVGLKRKRENHVLGSTKSSSAAPSAAASFSSSFTSPDLTNPADLVALELQACCCCPESTLNFLKPTDDMVSSYTLEVVSALRAPDSVAALRRLHESGASLQCCNRFGESLLHMACRRGLHSAVRFLVMEAGVSLLVRDDFGRTALHDAFWTPKPQFELVEFIVEQQPQLLAVKDVRGFAPLHYVRKEHWKEWSDFFTEHRNLLKPKRPCCRSQSSPKE